MDQIIACFTRKHSNKKLIDFITFNSSNFKNSTVPYTDNEKLSHFLKVSMDLKYEWQRNNEISENLFHLCNEQLKSFNRLCEWETKWSIYPLYYCALQLYRIGKQLDKLNTNKSVSFHKGDFRHEKYLEISGRTIHMSLNLCLKDRDKSDDSKRNGVYFFATILFDNYESLKNFGLINNMVKVLISRERDLPTPEESFVESKSLLVKYCYHLGKYYGCQLNDYKIGYHWLERALNASPIDDFISLNQKDAIMVYLVPMIFLTKKWYPSVVSMDKFPKTKLLYNNIITTLLNGNIQKFDQEFEKKQKIFLSKNLYLLIVQLREFVFLRTIKQIYIINDKKTQISIKTILTAYKTEKHDTQELTEKEKLDDIECLLANLIGKNRIKGYISHDHRMLVVSKAQPFPPV